MFSKSFIIFGLLALFACQGTTATQLTEIERASIGDLVNQIKELIAGLNNILSGVLGDALSTLKNLVGVVAEIKKKFLDEGLAVISGSVGNVLQFVANKTKQAADLGIDITKCIVGTNQTLFDIADGLVENLTECVTDTAGSVLATVNKEIENLNKIVKKIIAAPVNLSKCLISLRPLKCLGNLVEELTALVLSLPGDILKVVTDATQLVTDLPTHLGGCVKNITTSIKTETEAMIKEIGTCVDDLISQATTAAPIAQTTAAAPSPRALGDLINQVKEIISSLKELVTGVIGDAISILGNAISTINEIKEKYLDDGIALIKDTVGNVASFIKNKTEQAVELGIDISGCLIGRQEQVQDLTSGLVFNLTDCVTTTVVEVLQVVNKHLVTVNNIVQQITNAPVKLASCLVTLRPISCVTDLLGNLTKLLASIPSEIKEIVDNTVALVKDLPVELTKCIGKISTAATTQTDKIIADIGECVDDIISGTA